MYLRTVPRNIGVPVFLTILEGTLDLRLVSRNIALECTLRSPQIGFGVEGTNHLLRGGKGGPLVVGEEIMQGPFGPVIPDGVDLRNRLFSLLLLLPEDPLLLWSCKGCSCEWVGGKVALCKGAGMLPFVGGAL